MSRIPHVRLLCCALLVALAAALAPAPVALASAPVEDYADYQPARKCSPKAKPGTRELARWLTRRHGSHTTISRSCRRGNDVSSEHQEGRAIDWFANARTKPGRKAAKALLDDLFAADQAGNPAAKARRMGIIYATDGNSPVQV